MNNNLIIAVDARTLSEPITGIGRYTFEVLKRMVLMGNVSWYLYSHKPIIHGDWANCKNVKVFTTNLPGRLLRMLWAQSYLPLLIKFHGATHFWSPSHRIPFFTPFYVKKIVTIHDFVWKFAGQTMRPFSRYMDSILMPYAINTANVIITVSNSTAIDLKILFPNNFYKVISIPLAATLFSKHISKDKYNFKSFGRYILFVGTFEPRKNLQRLLIAFEKSIHFIPSDVKLIMVGGSGWGNLYINELLKRLISQKRIIRLGYVSDDELSLLYRDSLFLAMPSLYEGFGLPVIEAMSFGVPSLSSNISSMPEIVSDSGLLVDPYNIDSISQGIIELTNSEELRKKLSYNALLRIKNYTWDNTAKNTFEVIINNTIKE